MRWLLILVLWMTPLPVDTLVSEKSIACMKVDGRGTIKYNRIGLASDYECRRMHLLMKYRDGRFQ